MTVKDLAIELGMTNSEVSGELLKIGVVAKAYNSKVSDEDAEKLRGALKKGTKDSAKAESDKKTESEKKPESEKKTESPKQVQQPKKDAPSGNNGSQQKKPEGHKNAQQGQNGQQTQNAQQGQNPQQKKRSGIIMVTNSNNSGSRPQTGRPQGPRPGQASSRPGANQVEHKIIKPSFRPSSVEGTADFKENARKLDEASKSRSERSRADEEVKKSPAVTPPKGNEGSKPARPEGSAQTGKESPVKNQTPVADSKDSGRRSDSAQAGQRSGARQADRFKPNNSPAQPSVADQAPGSGKEDKRRNGGKDADKRNKKDLKFEEQEESRQKKAGRFIKPEKKVEEKVEEQIKVITLPETLTIKDLADKMKMQPASIIKKLFMQGQIVTVNSELSYEDAENIAMEYDILCEKEVKVDVIEELLKEEDEDESKMVSRPPVICVMGHVDHGKTSLLDAIRKTNVTDREAGGITQHIGAYTVNVNGQSITFLDTPGHEAFTAMRMRGANATDIAILVVAADDGVMPQTVEAINHAKAAGIEIIVAVNKIDKPGANIDRVKQEMTEYELIPVDWGGTTEFVPVSAKSGEGIDTLLETILLTAEILELKANPNRLSRGLVIEAELDKGRGPVARVLVQKGTLHVGDFVSAGPAHGKVRAMIDDKGRRIRDAKPSTPVEILGLSDVPSAGEVFISHENDKSAKNYAETYIAQNKEKKVEETKAKMSLDELFNQIQAENLKELNIIVKADVQGSVEAVKQSLMKLSNEEVVVKCIHGGVGAINESDVVLASASSAIIIGFNVRPDPQAKALSEREGVEIRLYKVIYQAIEEIEAAMKGMLDPVFEEKIIGHAEIRQIFKASAIGNIAGSKVMDGMFQRDCLIRITRAGEQVYEGKLKSLKRFKDDVKEVKEGFECGLVFEDYDQFEELDMVEAYIMVEVPR